MSPVKPGSKYFPLYRHLRRQPGERVVMTFAAVERVLASRLPASARRSAAFWSNRARGGLQAEAWLEAGFESQEVDVRRRRVVFARLARRYIVRREGDMVRWDGDLVRALRRHMEMDQAALAEMLGVRQQTISEWETGVYVPTRSRSKHLTLIAERAGFPLEGDSMRYRVRED
jgi:DNA-binding XRE family transcriptional regulator